MRRLKILLLRSLFILTMLFCLGNSAYSTCSYQPGILEFAEADSSNTAGLSSDIDYPENDQINQTFEISSFVKHNAPVSEPDTILPPEFCIYFWLPPQIS